MLISDSIDSYHKIGNAKIMSDLKVCVQTEKPVLNLESRKSVYFVFALL